ncbi:MAG: putative beta-lysine N-acetyltransferase [Methanoregula sp.]|jgi:putative beta-lysine N-acetyltransferase
MIPDAIEVIGKSRVQHGHFNNRIYVMHLDNSDIPVIIPRLDDLAQKNGYAKIVIRVPGDLVSEFHNAGYITEAVVPGFYAGKISTCFLGKYPDPKRQVIGNEKLQADVLSRAKMHPRIPSPAHLAGEFILSMATLEDAGNIATLYRETFESYPFPVFDPAFIRAGMNENVRYFCVWSRDQVAAVASVDLDTHAGNAELTDFATYLSFRGKGLAGVLLSAMEKHLSSVGIFLGYTIARATSYPMNVAFARAGYIYAGTLKNNTNICGTIENMNVWYRHLGKPGAVMP